MFFNRFYFIFLEDNDAISTDLFEAYVQQMHVDGDFGFAQLYEEITASTKMYTYSSDISLLECNRMKNRYSNILTCKLALLFIFACFVLIIFLQ